MVKKLGLKLKEQKGFTLIELLAVIVILGIIAAIAIPAISNVINKSQEKANAEEGLQIINAAKLIIANNEATIDSTTLKVTIDRDPATGVGLMDYLDRVDAKNPFQVEVKKATVASGGKLTYTLINHPAADAPNNATGDTGKSISEQDLIDKAK
ncbi:prepilin-type N-terminal cleavage/methylation domain-containing protein [Neobacillus mesonae]|uniref:prepilin-type N-terminal cleavage/methylation domain-containing protein n=1 Tax=Neobacillus mesonae TaxID=1193713 RepID=UPI00082BE48D|nr:prepilin-type N-terminal cleavage/methylation domain-containing protein [Neobacillus mesonae]